MTGRRVSQTKAGGVHDRHLLRVRSSRSRLAAARFEVYHGVAVG